MSSDRDSYKSAGVDIQAGYEIVSKIKKYVSFTKRTGAVDGIGGFGGLFDLTKIDVKEPVLVSGTDGVGTKLMIAIECDKHDTVGIDCVAMCVNDILASGAEPLYFLDYIAVGKMDIEKVEQIVKGISDGCKQANCALIGGESAEMPDMYGQDDYDLAGFSVGIAEKSKLMNKGCVQTGDILIGISSSGLHSNGFSLIRKIFFKDNSFELDKKLPDLDGQTLRDTLLTPTKIYVSSVLPLIKKGLLKGISHITGGGLTENIPRMLPKNLQAKISLNNMNKYFSLPIFDLVERYGNISRTEMYDIFNMGVGMVLCASVENVNEILGILKTNGESAEVIGKVDYGQSQKSRVVYDNL